MKIQRHPKINYFVPPNLKKTIEYGLGTNQYERMHETFVKDQVYNHRLNSMVNGFVFSICMYMHTIILFCKIED